MPSGKRPGPCGKGLSDFEGLQKRLPVARKKCCETCEFWGSPGRPKFCYIAYTTPYAMGGYTKADWGAKCPYHQFKED